MITFLFAVTMLAMGSWWLSGFLRDIDDTKATDASRWRIGRAFRAPEPPEVIVSESIVEECLWTALDDYQLNRLLRESSS